MVFCRQGKRPNDRAIQNQDESSWHGRFHRGLKYSPGSYCQQIPENFERLLRLTALRRGAVPWNFYGAED
jgi:hypothetical protein